MFDFWELRKARLYDKNPSVLQSQSQNKYGKLGDTGIEVKSTGKCADNKYFMCVNMYCQYSGFMV